jgi:hypothetical protein
MPRSARPCCSSRVDPTCARSATTIASGREVTASEPSGAHEQVLAIAEELEGLDLEDHPAYKQIAG